MAVQFNGTTTQGIDFSPDPSVLNLDKRSVVMWFQTTSMPSTASNLISSIQAISSTAYSWFSFGVRGTNSSIFFNYNFSSLTGSWTTPNNSIAINTIYFIGVTYDRTSLSNVPKMYISGSTQAISALQSPTGSIISENGSSIRIGSKSYPLTGTIYSASIYNRILTDSEMTDAYSSRLMIPNRNGLVFSWNPCGALGLQVFDGASLSTSSLMYDGIIGTSGVPSGSPVGISDTVLNINSW